jgi:hypothetical protein
LEESHSIQTQHLRATSSKGSSHRFEHTLNHRKLERDLQLTHHAQEPSIGFLHRNPLKKPPLGTAIFLRSTQRSIPTNFFSMPVSTHATSTVITTATIASSYL